VSNLITCTEAMWFLAAVRAAAKPVFPNSHRGQEANAIGSLGEVAASIWMDNAGIAFNDETGNTTHDFRLSNNKTIDVKTKDRTVVPKPNYDCSVPLYNHEHQRPDYYLFVSLLRTRDYQRQFNVRNFTHAYIVGAVNQRQLDARGRRWAAGEVDPENGTEFWTACINVRISQTTAPHDVARDWSRSCPRPRGKLVPPG
jgi:hypothetical protein